MILYSVQTKEINVNIFVGKTINNYFICMIYSFFIKNVREMINEIMKLLIKF